jgi:hypothetical protein
MKLWGTHAPGHKPVLPGVHIGPQNSQICPAESFILKPELSRWRGSYSYKEYKNKNEYLRSPDVEVEAVLILVYGRSEGGFELVVGLRTCRLEPLRLERLLPALVPFRCLGVHLPWLIRFSTIYPWAKQLKHTHCKPSVTSWRSSVGDP